MENPPANLRLKILVTEILLKTIADVIIPFANENL